MTIEKLSEFARDGSKEKTGLDLDIGFVANRKPARQWFNWLFNTLTLKINEIIDADFVQKTSIVDNLTTDEATKPISAKQAKILQDNKLDANKRGEASGVASLDANKKVPVTELPSASVENAGISRLVNDLTTGGTDKAITAEQVKLFFAMFDGGGLGRFKIPNPSEPNKPYLIQMGSVIVPSVAAGVAVTFPVAFPNACLYANAGDEHGATTMLDVTGTYNTTKTGTMVVLASQPLSGGAWSYPTAPVKWIAIGN